MRILFACSALLVPSVTPAAELLCEGTYYATSVGQVSASVPIQLNEKTLTVTVATLSGVATGAVKDTGSRYNGHVYSRQGRTYWLDLDRYTGSVATSFNKTDGSAMIEFSGDCRPAKKLF